MHDYRLLNKLIIIICLRYLLHISDNRSIYCIIRYTNGENLLREMENYTFVKY